MDYDLEMSAILGANIPLIDEYGAVDVPDETFVVQGAAPGPAPRVTVTTTRILRETKICKEVKEQNGHKCAFCGAVLARPHTIPYSEGCHIRPLNEQGPDVKENIIVLCPNHHVEFDYGAVSIDPATMKIQHMDPNNPLHGKVVNTSHRIDSVYVDYHFQKWRKGSLMAI